jgi:DNA-binding CsgD family transcriptional regulator
MKKTAADRSIFRLNGEYTGMFFLISFDTLLSIQTFPSGEAGIAAIGYITRYLVSFLVLFGVAVLSRRLYPLHKHNVLALIAVAACISGGILLVTYRVLLSLGVLLLLGSVLVGVGTALLTLFWLEFYSRLNLTRVASHYSATHILSSLIIVCYPIIGPSWIRLTLFLVFPLLSYFLYRRSLFHVEGETPIVGATVSSQWSFPVRPVLLVGLFTLTNVLTRSYLPDSGRGIAALGVTISIVPVFLYACFASQRFDIRVLYQASFPLVIIGPLCMIAGGDTFGLLGALGTNAAYTYLALFVAVMLCNVSFRYGVNPLWLFGFAFGAISLGRVFAKLSELALSGFPDHNIVFCTIILLLAIVFTSLANNRDYNHTWGIEPTGEPSSQDLPLDDMVERCARMARVRGLTRREEEILFYLAQDMSIRTIASKIYLAESTIKTHIKHVYAKLNIHSKNELQEAIRK